ncbi:MAG: hypothetical protein RI973_321 [Bacteroidota bacterium]|jgi:cytochrome P450
MNSVIGKVFHRISGLVSRNKRSRYDEVVRRFDFGADLPTMLQDVEYLRSHGPLHYLPYKNSWLVLDYEPAKEIARNHRFFSNTLQADFDFALIGADPPGHTRVRSLLQAFFLPQSLKMLEDFTAAKASQLLEDQLNKKQFDLISDLAIPLGTGVLDELLGLENRETQALLSAMPGGIYHQDHHRVDAFFQQYCQAEGRQESSQGLIVALREMVETGDLSVPQAASLVKLFWVAGAPTASVLLGNIGTILLKKPDIKVQLQQDPGLIGNFIEETLRLQPPAHQIVRQCKEAVVVEGSEIPASALITISTVAVNRDPKVFSSPNEYELKRPSRQHLSFGTGPHHCLGIHVARMTAACFARELLAVIDQLEPDPVRKAATFSADVLRGYSSYPVRWKGR